MWKCNTDIFTLKTAPVHHAWTNAGERSSCVKKQLYVNEPRRSFKITEATWEKRFREFEILLGKNRQPLQRWAAVRPPSALHLKACISACLQPRPLSNWEHLAWKIPKKTTQGWWAARILHQTRCEQYSRNTATTCCCDQSQTDLGGGAHFLSLNMFSMFCGESNMGLIITAFSLFTFSQSPNFGDWSCN